MENFATDEVMNSAQSINLLPFSINFDGPVPASTYFIKSVENQIETAHFRGRKLLKKTINLPEPFTGIHLIIPGNQSGGCDREASIQSTFKQLGEFGHDIQPSSREIEECIEWLELSEEVTHILMLMFVDPCSEG
jgi:hypothetical protein